MKIKVCDQKCITCTRSSNPGAQIETQTTSSLVNKRQPDQSHCQQVADQKSKMSEAKLDKLESSLNEKELLKSQVASQNQLAALVQYCSDILDETLET